MEDLKISEEYIRAFNDADMICTYMPDELENMEIPEQESMAYTQGFKDRIRQYQIEKDAVKNLTIEELKEKYGKELEDYQIDLSKERGMDMDK